MKNVTYRNILIIKPGAMGDLLQITPALRAIKRRFPETRITLLVGSVADTEMFRYNQNVDAALVYNKRGEHKSFTALLELWLRLRRCRFDLVINFQRSNVKAWFLAAAAFPCRVLVYHKARNRTVHAVVNHLETVAPLGIDPVTADHRLELVPGPDAERLVADMFAAAGFQGKTVVALNPGASNRIKCWAPQRLAALGERLGRELGAAIVIVGGRGEKDLADQISSDMSHPPLDLVGKTSLLELGAVLKRCSLLVSGDTGPMHMATAVGTPVIALFGAIDPERTGPVGEGHRVIQHPEIKCVPCNAKACDNQHHLACMEEISVEEVYGAVVGMLARNGTRP